MTPERVAVAMSGGVDSAVAAAMLMEQGVDAFGVMLRLWVEDGRINRCCSPADVAAARRTAGLLGMPFYVLDMRERFHQEVVTAFVEGYASGITPNPCIECNRRIRWTHLLAEAVALGATHLATGHYARVESRQGSFALLRAADHDKDQSYVLSILTQAQLGHARFPLGRLTKSEVRSYARRRGLPVAERPESQDLCFLAGQDYRDFLRTHADGRIVPGPIIGPNGEVFGEHTGLAHYTIGQRKGLGVQSNAPLFVLAKEVNTNALVIGPRECLGRSAFRTQRTNWVQGSPPGRSLEAEVQVRYRAARVTGRITPIGPAEADVTLTHPVADVTPGQAAVFYQGDVCLGGGTITL